MLLLSTTREELSHIWSIDMGTHKHASMRGWTALFTSRIFLRLILALVVSGILVLAMFATSAR